MTTSLISDVVIFSEDTVASKTVGCIADSGDKDSF